jgi:hypothetical protein
MLLCFEYFCIDHQIATAIFPCTFNALNPYHQDTSLFKLPNADDSFKDLNGPLSSKLQLREQLKLIAAIR